MSNMILRKIISSLWFFWGIVHILFGILIMNGDVAYAINEIGNAVTVPVLKYSSVAEAIMNQHGWNLTWFGVITIIGSVFIWRGNNTALWVSAMIGGLADLGYFIFLDLGGFVKFLPGTLMTIIALTAIVMSVIVNKRKQ